MKIIVKKFALIALLGFACGAGYVNAASPEPADADDVVLSPEEQAEKEREGLIDYYMYHFLRPDVVYKAYYTLLLTREGAPLDDWQMKKFIQLRDAEYKDPEEIDKYCTRICNNCLSHHPGYSDYVATLLNNARISFIELLKTVRDRDDEESALRRALDAEKRKIDTLLEKFMALALQAEYDRRYNERMAPEAVAKREAYAQEDQARLETNKAAFNLFLEGLPEADRAEIIARTKKAYSQLYGDAIYNADGIVEKGKQVVLELTAEREAARLKAEREAAEAAAREAERQAASRPQLEEDLRPSDQDGDASLRGSLLLAVDFQSSLDDRYKSYHVLGSTALSVVALFGANIFFEYVVWKKLKDTGEVTFSFWPYFFKKRALDLNFSKKRNLLKWAAFSVGFLGCCYAWHQAQE